MSRLLRCCALVLALGPAGTAAAQDPQPAVEAPLDLFAPTLPVPRTGSLVPLPTEPSAMAVPYAPSTSGLAGGQVLDQQLVLEARLAEGEELLKDGVTWRVFGAAPGPDGRLPLVATAEGGTGTVRLPAGTYFVHCAFGFAEETRRIQLGSTSQSEALVLNAGGIRLSAVVGEDEPVTADRITFEVSRELESGEREVVVAKAAPGQILPLDAGTYHVVSRYGAVNSEVRADIEVEPGKLTEATIHHDGAEAMLKLVSAPGGEALANTRWTVTTEAGDTVHESIGAFPRIILEAGKYTAVASHKGQTFIKDFEIVSGRHATVEVSLEDVPPGNEPGSGPQTR